MFARRPPAADVDWSDPNAALRHQIRALEARVDNLYVVLILFLFVLTAVLMVAFSVVR